MKKRAGKKLSYEKWFEKNEEEITIMLAETGADRELDFDAEVEFERLYNEYRKP